VLVFGWYVVIGRSSGAGCVKHANSTFTQPIEGLWAGNFVDKVPIYKQGVGMALGMFDNVGIPDFIEEGGWLIHGLSDQKLEQIGLVIQILKVNFCFLHPAQ
jgi:hypothetical protein